MPGSGEESPRPGTSLPARVSSLCCRLTERDSKTPISANTSPIIQAMRRMSRRVEIADRRQVSVRELLDLSDMAIGDLSAAGDGDLESGSCHGRSAYTNRETPAVPPGSDTAVAREPGRSPLRGCIMRGSSAGSSAARLPAPLGARRRIRLLEVCQMRRVTVRCLRLASGTRAGSCFSEGGGRARANIAARFESGLRAVAQIPPSST